MKRPMQVRCPACRKRGLWFEGQFGPFCSKRCQLVDLGKWFEGEHVISDPLRPGHFAGYEDLPPGQQLDRPEEGEDSLPCLGGGGKPAWAVKVRALPRGIDGRSGP